jgi:hypothetical protein
MLSSHAASLLSGSPRDRRGDEMTSKTSHCASQILARLAARSTGTRRASGTAERQPPFEETRPRAGAGRRVLEFRFGRSAGSIAAGTATTGPAATGSASAAVCQAWENGSSRTGSTKLGGTSHNPIRPEPGRSLRRCNAGAGFFSFASQATTSVSKCRAVRSRRPSQRTGMIQPAARGGP